LGVVQRALRFQGVRVFHLRNTFFKECGWLGRMFWAAHTTLWLFRTLIYNTLLGRW
jgi:hypothetical protein